MKTTLTLILCAVFGLGASTPAWAKQDNSKVTITWTTPAAGSTFTAPASLTLTVDARARQTSHPITLVEFFNGGSLIGSQTTPVNGSNYQINLPNVTPGTYTLSARATNDKGDFDQTVPITVTVIKADQTITGFNPASPITFTVAPNNTFTLNASGGASNNPITFASSTPSVCTTNGNTATVIAAGTCTLTANQAGDTNDNAAAQASANVIINPATQTITGFSPASPITFAVAPNNTFALNAAGGASNNPITFASSTPSVCTTNGNIATVITAGTCTLKANQAGNGNYTAAAQASANVIINPAAQAITGFNPVSPITVAPNDTFALNASGGASNNPVTFASSTPDVCSVTGNTATVITAGTCTLTANQLGDTNYSAAPTLTASVIITLRPTIAQLYYIHTDQLDTPREITDTNDNVVWQWDNSDPFGNNAPNENPTNQGTFRFDLRFPGQVFDQETNTHYNINRDYDPATGRYLQSDPIGLAGGSYSTYSYVNNNPISLVDPLGTGYLQNVAANFTQTNNAIPGMGLLLPTGVGLATSGITATATGGITFLGAFSFYGTSQFGGALLFAGLNSGINSAAVGGALQFGILVGSLINSIPTNSCGATVRDSVSNFLSNNF